MSGETNDIGLGGPSSGPGLVGELSSRVRLFELPGRLRTALAADFASWAAARRPASLGQRLMARLTVDGSAAAMAAGLRGGATVGRDLLFECDLAEVAVRIDDGAQPSLVDGQVLVLAESDALPVGVELWSADGVARFADADEAGSFVFEDVAPGSYRMVITIGDDEVEVGPIDVALPDGPAIDGPAIDGQGAN